ncbi:hypothetical protein NKH77_50530 [Streptomyces sp. M19]
MASGEVVRDVLLDGMGIGEARATARALARFEDPRPGSRAPGCPT